MFLIFIIILLSVNIVTRETVLGSFPSASYLIHDQCWLCFDRPKTMKLKKKGMKSRCFDVPMTQLKNFAVDVLKFFMKPKKMSVRCIIMFFN